MACEESTPFTSPAHSQMDLGDAVQSMVQENREFIPRQEGDNYTLHQGNGQAVMAIEKIVMGRFTQFQASCSSWLEL